MPRLRPSAGARPEQRQHRAARPVRRDAGGRQRPRRGAAVALDVGEMTGPMLRRVRPTPTARSTSTPACLASPSPRARSPTRGRTCPASRSPRGHARRQRLPRRVRRAAALHPWRSDARHGIDHRQAPVTGTSPTGTGQTEEVDLNRATFLLDVLWSLGERSLLPSADIVVDGVALVSWTGCTRSSRVSVPRRPPRCRWLAVRQAQIEEAAFLMTNAEANDAGDEFCSVAGWSSSASDRTAGSSTPDYPVAVGRDGTRYSLMVWTEDPTRTYCRINLVARHPNGALRWTRRIAENALPLFRRNHEWDVRISPQARRLRRATGVPARPQAVRGCVGRPHLARPGSMPAATVRSSTPGAAAATSSRSST